jgi:annexin A7/11
MNSNKYSQAGIHKLGTDEETFRRILCLRSFPQIKATVEEYKAQTESDLEIAIDNEFNGDIENALLTIGRNKTDF